MSVVLHRGVRWVLGVPAEPSPVVLTVKRQALLGVFQAISLGSVPAVMGNRTLKSHIALLIRRAQFGAAVGPGPCVGALTELLLGAISMVVAEFSLQKSLTYPIQTIHTFTLPRVLACAAIVEHGFEGHHLAAVSFGPLVIQLTVGHVGGGFVALRAPVLVLLVDPSVFV